MDVKEWQRGINISINNGIELYDNGKLLIDKGSCGHGLFFLITALEEISVAYFIMESFNTPRPDQLQRRKFLEHRKKMALTNYKAAQFAFFDDNIIQEKLVKENKRILQKEINNKVSAFYDKVYRNVGKEITEEIKLWELRNRGIYVSLNKDKTSFLSPQDISKEKALEIARLVNLQIIHVQIQRDVLFKYGGVSKQIIQLIINEYERVENVFELARILESQSIEELEVYEGIKPEDKKFLEQKLFNNEQIDLNDKSVLFKIFQIILSPIIINTNNFSNNREDQEKLRFYHERLMHYNKNQAQLYELSSKILKSITDGTFNLDDVKEYYDLYSNETK